MGKAQERFRGNVLLLIHANIKDQLLKPNYKLFQLLSYEKF